MSKNLSDIRTISKALRAAKTAHEYLSELRRLRDEAIAKAHADYDYAICEQELKTEAAIQPITDYLQRINASAGFKMTLPTGSITLCKNPPSITITDEDAARAWLSQHAPTCLRFKTEIDKTAIKKTLPNAPGIEICSTNTVIISPHASDPIRTKIPRKNESNLD